jgi:hypothetical protein
MIEVLEYGRHKYSTFKDDNGNLFKGSEITPQEVKDRNLSCVYDARDNWKKGFDTSEVLESLQRHVAQLFDGEVIDKESGLHHIGHIMCNAMFYSYYVNKESNDNQTGNL